MISEKGRKFLELALRQFGQGEVKKSALLNLMESNDFVRSDVKFILNKEYQSRWGYYNLYPIDKYLADNDTLAENANTLVMKPHKEKERDISLNELFQDLSELSDLVIQNYRPSLLVTGNGGTGKSYTVLKRLAENNLVKGDDYKIIKGGVSTFGLYIELFLARNGKLLIFDDCDSIFNDMTSQNLLKAALDSYDDRELSWTSKSTQQIDPSSSPSELNGIYQTIEDTLLSGDERVRLPNYFPFFGRVIFISNQSKNKIPQPILSRSLSIDVTLSQSEMVERMRMVLDDVAADLGVNKEFAKSTMDTLLELSNSGKINAPTMRTLPSAIKIKMSGNPRWSELLKYTS